MRSVCVGNNYLQNLGDAHDITETYPLEFHQILFGYIVNSPPRKFVCYLKVYL